VRTGHPYIRLYIWPVQNSNSFQLYGLSIQVVCTKHPYIPAVFTAHIYGCIFDTRTYGRYIRAICTGSAYRSPVYTACTKKSIVRNAFWLYGTYIRVVCTERPYIRSVFTARIYGCILTPVHTARMYEPYCKNLNQ